MKLARYEQEKLDGNHGETKRIAMAKLVNFGVAVNATEMAPLVNVHYVQCILMPRSTPDFSKYEYGQTALFRPFIEMGARVTNNPACICTTEPGFVQYDIYEEKGYPWNHSRYKLPRAVYDGCLKGCEACKTMGWVMAQTCTPQFNTVIPKRGEYVSSLESSYAAYINSLIGARTNKHDNANVCGHYWRASQIRDHA